MGWFTANTKIKVRLGHNQSISSMFEDPTLNYVFDDHEVDLTRDIFKV